jgi:hypothetical protein
MPRVLLEHAMTIRKPLLLFGTLLAALVAFQLFAARPNDDQRAEARYAPITITLDDQVLWWGNASDDGHANADVVWARLQTAPLRRGEDFAANISKMRLDGDTASLEGEITIDVRYGGQITLRKLTMTKVQTDKGERWTVPAGFAEKWFWSRMVQRRSVPDLEDIGE